ncbi:MAG: hypothetical protein KFF73_11810 [Cyclobacteriaceae bacterium]|nr:hypothetical protein [Cyclobacteriaceae bacterium]
MEKTGLWMTFFILCGGVALFLCCNPDNNGRKQEEKDVIYVPEIRGEWWQIAGNPDLGELTAEEQEPVDFGIWQAADGTWQLWSCIRKTGEQGHTRLFHRWEGDSLTQTFWEPKGIAMRGDTAFGEARGGLQAPYVIQRDGKYLMFYGDWNRICLAESSDGKNFERVLVDGSPALFGDPAETNTRDPMVIRTNDQWYCYYTAHPDNEGAIYVRTSDDLLNWSESTIVSYGGSPGKGELWFAECPHVIPFQGKYYLFRTYSYKDPRTNIYSSDSPENFGIDTDSLLVAKLPVAAPEIFMSNGKWYIAALMPDIQGIRIAELKWTETED